LENPRKLIYIAEPSKDFEQEIQQQENSMLKDIVKNKVKSEKDETKIQEFNAELQRRQMSKEGNNYIQLNIAILIII
jgi:LPS O-antigen subunit length determinant protein (WzzB/FepE family)